MKVNRTQLITGVAAAVVGGLLLDWIRKQRAGQ